MRDVWPILQRIQPFTSEDLRQGVSVGTWEAKCLEAVDAARAKRLRALGNAAVPVRWIGEQILKADHFVDANNMGDGQEKEQMMPTIEINGHVLPVPEGCPDIKIIVQELKVSGALIKKCEWNRLYSYEKRHAACVAAEWFEHKANTQGLRFGHLMNHGHGDYEIYQECKKAAKAWRRLIDWGGVDKER